MHNAEGSTGARPATGARRPETDDRRLETDMRVGLAVSMVLLLVAATAWQGEGRGAVEAQGRAPAGTTFT